MTNAQILAKLWQAKFNAAPKVGDDFFEMGGDSLGAIELMHDYEAESKCSFPLEVLFAAGTFGALVEAL